MMASKLPRRGLPRCLLLLLGVVALALKPTEIGSKGELSEFVAAAKAEKQWMLLDFYAPWCGHCKRLNPVLDEFGDKRESVRIGKIDATKHKSLATTYDVDGYPTLLFATEYDDDETSSFKDYKGPRDLAGLEATDTRLTRPPVVVSSLDDDDEKKKEVLFELFPHVAFVASSTLDPEWKAVFEAVAKDRYHEATFGYVDDDDDSLGGGGKKKLGLLEKDEPGFFFAYEGPADVAAFKAWVKKHNAPSFAEPLGPGIFRRVAASRLVVAAVVDGKNTTQQDAATPVKPDDLAAAVKGVFRKRPALREDFAAGQLDGKRWADYVATYDVHALPHLLVIDLPGKRYWNLPLHDERQRQAMMTADAIIAHLTDVLSGATRPRYQGIRGFPARAKSFYFERHFLKCNAALLLLITCLAFLLRSSPRPKVD